MTLDKILKMKTKNIYRTLFIIVFLICLGNTIIMAQPGGPPGGGGGGEVVGGGTGVPLDGGTVALIIGGLAIVYKKYILNKKTE